MPVQTLPADPAAESGARRPPITMVAVATGFAFLLVQLDVSIVNVALASMRTELRSGIAGLQWIVDAYALAFSALLLFGGALGDRAGARRVFVSGYALFVAASLGCGLAPGLQVLIAARVVQGAGAAMMVPSSLALLNHACKGDDTMRARAVGLWTAAGSVGLALGPILGGILIGPLGWRSIFLVNIPVGMIGIVLTLRHVEEAERRRGGFDPAGQILGILALFGLVGAVIEAGPRGWSSPVVLAGLGLGAAAGLAFVRVERNSADPMLPLDFFRHPVFSAAMLVGLLINFTLYGIIFVLGLYFQTVLGYSPSQTGRAFLAFTAAVGVANVVAGRIAAAVGVRVLMAAGIATGAVGAALLRRVGPDTPYVSLLPGLLVISCGVGLAVPTMTSALLSTVPRERAGIASGVLNTVRQAGGAAGVAVFGSFLVHDPAAGTRVALTVSVAVLAAAAVTAWFGVRPRPADIASRERRSEAVPATRGNRA